VAGAAASLRRRWLACRRVCRTKLRLDELFAGTVADLDQTLVITFAGLRNTKDVLADGNVCQHDAARAADARLPLIVNIDLGVRRPHNDYPRHAGLAVLDVLRRV